MKDAPLKTYIIILSTLILINCNQNESKDFDIIGKWKELKSQNEYEKNKKEGLIDIYQKDSKYEGKIISLDSPLEGNNEVRKCLVCNTETDSPVMLLGTIIIKDLQKKSNHYIGKIYDTYNRKWFDLKITQLNETQINLRIYAYLSLFGKNIIMEKGDNFYKEIIKNEPTSIDKSMNLYGISIGDVDETNEGLIKSKCSTSEIFSIGSIGYLFDRFGKMQEIVEMIKKEENNCIFKVAEGNSLKVKGNIIYFYDK